MMTDVPDLLRPASAADRTWLVALVTDPDVAPALAPGARTFTRAGFTVEGTRRAAWWRAESE
jgi:hypothetical protein